MIKHSNLQGKTIFRSNYFVSQPLLLSCYFNNIFVYLSVTAAVSFFNFKQISYFLSASIIDSEQVNVSWAGIHLGNKLTFEPHVKSLHKKASQKIKAFAKSAYSLIFDQRKLLLLNAFITA